MAVVASAAVALTACGSSNPQPSGDSIAPPDSTDVTSGWATSPEGDWVAISGSVGGSDVELIDGWDITVSIDGDQIGGTAACNGYGGEVQIGAEGALDVGELSWTEMGCESAVQAVEQTFLASLGTVTNYSVDGDALTLSNESDEWVFERLVAIDDASIVGTTWVLDTYILGEAASNMPGMSDATLRLESDGSLTGSTGCRELTGTWVDTGAEIVFTDFSAAGECPPELGDLDNVVVSVLGDGFTPTVDENRLTVMSQGNEGLSYTASITASTGE